MNHNNVTGWEGNGKMLDVTAYMARWIDQSGFPVINIEWDKANSKIRTTQKRFLLGTVEGQPDSSFG